MHTVEPQKEHEWLHQLVGEWTFETEAIMAPDQPPAKCAGAETVRSLGGVWVVCEGRSEMPGGGAANTIMTLGFDPAKKRFVGTFIASMMTNLWVYEGELHEAGNMLTLDTLGPSFTTEGKLVKYQDIIEVKNADHRVLSSQAIGEAGKWVKFMTANYRRVK